MVERHSAGIGTVLTITEENALVATAGQPLCNVVALLADIDSHVEQVATNGIVSTPFLLIFSCVPDFVYRCTDKIPYLKRRKMVLT